MSRRVLPTLFLCAVLLMACGGPRKACRKAARLQIRAAMLCPELLRVDTARRTATLQMPGDTTTAELPWSDPDLDSLLAACEQLREAFAADAELMRMERDTLVARLLVRERPHARHAVRQVRAEACTFEPFTVHGRRSIVLVEPGDGQPKVTVVDLPVTEAVNCPPCPPQTVLDTASPTRAVGWLWWLLVAGLLVALAVWMLRMNTRAWRLHENDGA